MLIRSGMSRQYPFHLTWSTDLRSISTMTFVPTCRINRYYDPSTDSFISVDPDVQQTDQPYVFVNDDPLNAEESVGTSR